MKETNEYKPPIVESLNQSSQTFGFVLPGVAVAAGLLALFLTNVVVYTQGLVVAVAAGAGVVHAVVGYNVTPSTN